MWHWQYLDYKFFKSINKLVDKLVEECSVKTDRNEMILVQYTLYYLLLLFSSTLVVHLFVFMST